MLNINFVLLRVENNVEQGGNAGYPFSNNVLKKGHFLSGVKGFD